MRYQRTVVCTFFMLLCANGAAADDKPWWSDKVKAALKQAGENRAELTKALQQTAADQRTGMAFLIRNMPESDLRSLKAEFLLENVRLAYQARKQFTWGKQIPEEIFLNDVLPYANVNEARDSWRKELFDLCAPIVKDCSTPSEAAQRLNAGVFKKLKVRFSTKRNRPHQSPKETIEIGMASCTGLSILLSDACRSVGVPARLVGTPQWSDVPGNHTWVEVWDKGWHFTGACEPDPKGLNRAWFAGRASKAKKDSRLNAIYAASFRRTETTFPLVWDRTSRSVFAENVTDRYVKKKETPGKSTKLSNEQAQRIKEGALDYFKADAKKRAGWKFDASLNQCLATNEDEVRQLVWDAYRTAPINAAAKKDFDKHEVRYQKHLSPYVVKTVGKRPKDGWPLFIAMHGGGGVPKNVNDSQWQVMQRYYRDQSSVTGYKYLALRAPNDTWNGFYDLYVPPLVTNLIRQFLLFGDVDSSKVYLMGYSHGGYGAFFIGPKIPDRFAAVHASAAAPTDGTISPLTLRNTRFTFMIGENDTRYGRRTRCEAFSTKIEKLKKENEGAFPVAMEFKKGFGHGGLPDRDTIKEMYPHVRNATPKHLTWEMTDSVITDFFWLRVPQPKAKQLIESSISGNDVKLTTRGVNEFSLYLDGRLVDCKRPLQIVLNGKKLTEALRPSLRVLCDSLLDRGDPALAFTCRVELRE